MKLSFSLLGIFTLIGWVSLVAQPGGIYVWFEFTLAGKPLQLDESYYLPSLGDSIKLETLQFYISDPQLAMDEKAVAFADQYFLMDAASPNGLVMAFPNVTSSSLNTLKFKLGIDSLTNIDGAKGGALDPINGMYWSWQSGYINTKIEGTSPLCPARHHRFQYHLGGYQAPNNSLQEVVLKVKPSSVIHIEIDLALYFQQLNLGEEYQVMSPSERAAALSRLFASCFKPLP